LAAGVSRVWVVDPEAASVRAFFPDNQVTFYTDYTKITDLLFPGLSLTPLLVFEEAELFE